MFSSVPEIVKPTSIKLRQKVYDQIKKEIITCALAPGESLSEASFAERFHVSKTPVREALTSLQQNNLVEYRPNKGFTVTAITLKDIQDIFEARLFFETRLIQLAIRHITEPEIQALDRCQQVTYDWNDPESIERYIQANTDFHIGIARAARNGRLIWYYQQLFDEAQRLIYLDLKNNNVLETWHRSHGRFIDAIRQRDEQAGITAIEETMENGKKRILGI